MWLDIADAPADVPGDDGAVPEAVEDRLGEQGPADRR